jgi:hypothetical protein
MEYLLILGTQRSGKTVLGRALNMHPKISIQKEPFFFYFKLCRNIFYRDILNNKNFDNDSPMSPNFCRSFEEKELLKNNFSKIRFSKKDIEELKRLTILQQDAEDGERAPKIKSILGKLSPGTAPEIFGQLMGLLQEAYCKNDLKYLGFTEGWCDEFVEILLGLPEYNIKIIQCLRDVRSIVASRNKGKNLKEKGYSGKYPILFILRHWRKAIAYSLKNRNNPKYLSVRYENFVREPSKTLTEICRVLDLSLIEDMLDPSKFIQGDGSIWKQNTTWDAADPKKGFSTSSVEKWKEALTEDEIGIIEYLCKPEMEYLHMEMLRPDYTLSDLLKFKENIDEIEGWLKKYYVPFDERELTLEIIRKFMIENKYLFNAKVFPDYFCVEEEAYEILSGQYK